MRIVPLRSLLLLSALYAALPAAPVKAEDQPDPDQVVNAFETLSGVHKGLRRNHAKGSCVVGSFVGTAAAGKVSSSAWFSGKSVPVIGRFSVAGPNPGNTDLARVPRGLALQFQLPKDELQQTTMLNTPVFGAATVNSFYEALLAGAPDPATGKPDPEKLKAYAATHPDAQGQRDWLASHNPPPAYGNASFYSLHAFKFVKGKKETWVKWRFEPHDGVTFMTDAELAAAPHDFLDQSLLERTRKGPVQWDMIVTIGQKGDPLDNPAIAWPAGRKEFKAGVLTLTKGGADAAGQCEDVNFDPNVLSAGVEASPDAILQYRSAAYAESYSRRESEKE